MKTEFPDVRHPERGGVRLVLIAAALFCLMTLPGIVSQADAMSNWHLETVDGPGGTWSSIAVNGIEARISFYGGAAENLRYAERDNQTGWTTITVDPDFLQGGYTSLALSAAGEPRISYRDGVNDNLEFAQRNGGVWIRTYVDGENGADAGQFTSLALTSSGQPRISHYDTIFNNLKYSESNNGGGAWSNVYVDGLDGLNAGTYTSIALDAFENPHISYYDATNGRLKHAMRQGVNWSNESVDDPPTAAVGTYTSMKIGNGVIHISYFDDTNGDLKYAANSGAGWQIVTVDNIGRVGEWTSLALDGSGNPHISYYDVTNTALKHAQRTGGVWSTETVDAAGTVGSYTSLALDPQGRAHISYHDAVNNQLRYATNCPEVVSYPSNFSVIVVAGGVSPDETVRTIVLREDRWAFSCRTDPIDRATGACSSSDSTFISVAQMNAVYSAVVNNAFFTLLPTYLDPLIADGTFADMRITAGADDMRVMTQNMAVPEFDNIVQVLNSVLPVSFHVVYNAINP